MDFALERWITVPPGINVVAVDLSVQLENLAYKAQKTQTGVSCAGSSSRSNIGSLNYKHDYPVVKRYHNRFWSCFSRFESWPGSSCAVVCGSTRDATGRMKHWVC